MRIVTIRSSNLHRLTIDKEMLHNSDRPCVLILKLKYKGVNHCFAVPIRSNISAASPKNEYFPLPPRYTTRSERRHGLHYIKMFPVDPSWGLRYRTEGNTYAVLIKSIIDRNEKRIIKECQDYLQRYENGNRPKYATDIDLLLTLI